MQSPADYYQQKKKELNTLLDRIKKTGDRLAMGRLWMAIAGVSAFIYAFRNGESWQWWLFAATVAGFLALVRYHTQLTEKQEELRIQFTLIDNELKALQGDHSAFPDGAEYTNVAHPYTYDLDIFGKGSVYQLLCRSATRGGARQLAENFATLFQSKSGIADRQEIINELSTLPDLLQDFRVAGAIEKEGDHDQKRLSDWLNGEDGFINNTGIKAITVTIQVSAIALIACTALSIAPPSFVSLFIILNWVILGIYQKKIKKAIAQIGNSEAFIDKFERLLSQLATNDFKGQWLQTAGAQAKQSLKGIKQFKSLLRLLDSRDNVFLGPVLNSLFLFDLYCMLRLEMWRKKHKATLLNALDTVTTVDVYVSCAVYTFNNPDNIYPTLHESGNIIIAKDLRHPLLPPATAIGNDVNIGKDEQFYLLTGANMTGKSTFIRTIGVTNVLCNMGVPLPAKELSMPIIDMYTSMRITDSVQDDVSYFRAELNRIKSIMDVVRTADRPYLVLLDEPLRGTNSTDKQQGTRSIVETLLTFHAIGIVATHDTGLGDMATHYKDKVSNYHFESKVEPNRLSFDFKLKRGVSTSNNATILMKQMGIVN
ncbi:hypothetical protein CJD36_004715 [Flavipsychrobacter stenotrophus]|uniref:DNA mismatch repair proteins mutS family domain-containing protein n=1 Tax=Flavipsychrobacter stenotrophus TaxID=2077091 RepID=A0A2S7T1G6_9BACT|nr:hypothetical protein [Flavipsychrobacter stenotrophus]PQJ13049.1 hypothetical protein CJD36_004715 [Flavipsychrobacter stenotrophus]